MADDAPIPGSIDWLKARAGEHKTAQDQALAQFHAHAGAQQAYQRLLDELINAASASTAED